jgi:tryptophan halogenase
LSSENISKIVIVGGGTAGWMAAAALSKLLGKHLDICLIESDEIGTVGVGEATIPLLGSFHQLLGIAEQDFMRATQATFKLGIQFENWGAIGDKYLHGFGIVGKDCWACSFHHFWAKSRLQGNKATLVDYSLHEHAAKAGKFKLDLESGLAYAYHLDATLYAMFLRNFSEQQGVRRIEGKVVDVATRAESGEIESVTLESGEIIGGELFRGRTDQVGRSTDPLYTFNCA